MRQRSVIVSPEARADLALYDWIARRGSPAAALDYVERLEDHLATFAFAAERGARRDDLRPGLRIASFRRRVTLAFSVDDARVVIVRVFYAGRDWASVLDESRDG